MHLLIGFENCLLIGDKIDLAVRMQTIGPHGLFAYWRSDWIQWKFSLSFCVVCQIVCEFVIFYVHIVFVIIKLIKIFENKIIYKKCYIHEIEWNLWTLTCIEH